MSDLAVKVSEPIALKARLNEDWLAVVIGFALFRLFDVFKPWPIRKLEQLPGGWGIVLDDIAAGLFGAAVMAALRFAKVLP